MYHANALLLGALCTCTWCLPLCSCVPYSALNFTHTHTHTHTLYPPQEEVHAGLSNKQPKIVVACLELFTAALKEFGAKVMDVKKLMKTVPAQLEHKDKNVREAAKGLAVEMYRWLGPALKVSLEGSLKPVQV